MAIIGGWRLRYKLKAKRPKRKMLKVYQERNEKIAELGYRSYKEYLASDDWKAIRERKMRPKPQCLTCQSSATQVHHLDYSFEVLLGLYNALLVCLCDSCHELIEFDGERKRTLQEANEVLTAMVPPATRSSWLRGVKYARQRINDERKRMLGKPTWEAIFKSRRRHPRSSPATSTG